MFKYIFLLTIILLITSLYACDISQKNKLTPLTEEQIIDGLVNLYSIDAKMAETDTIYSDSLRAKYIKQYFNDKGYDKSRFDASVLDLKNYPDSLNMLQSRALDTIRVLIERSYKTTVRPAYDVN